MRGEKELRFGTLSAVSEQHLCVTLLDTCLLYFQYFSDECGFSLLGRLCRVKNNRMWIMDTKKMFQKSCKN